MGHLNAQPRKEPDVRNDVLVVAFGSWVCKTRNLEDSDPAHSLGDGPASTLRRDGGAMAHAFLAQKVTVTMVVESQPTRRSAGMRHESCRCGRVRIRVGRWRLRADAAVEAMRKFFLISDAPRCTFVLDFPCLVLSGAAAGRNELPGVPTMCVQFVGAVVPPGWPQSLCSFHLRRAKRRRNRKPPQQPRSTGTAATGRTVAPIAVTPPRRIVATNITEPSPTPM